MDDDDERDPDDPGPDEVFDCGPCPNCGGQATVPILWGLPRDDDYVKDAGRSQFGGCIIPENPPNSACATCGYEWITRHEAPDQSLEVKRSSSADKVPGREKAMNSDG